MGFSLASRRRRRLESAGERARRVHSAWLTRALTDPRLGGPRIPVRPVDHGGFDAMLARPGGRQVASGWWRRAIALVLRRERELG